MKVTDEFVFFFTNRDIFSNWYIASFKINEMYFNCVEQYMMYQKAKLFHDRETAIRIMNTEEPAKQKMLGRLVKDFDDTQWVKYRLDFVKDACVAKYRQNPELLKILLETDSKTIVEASPYDRIWGIGLAKDHPDIENPRKWRGLNLAGKALMIARKILKKEQTNVQ
jgi:ribA/ribD-fused uncharacterized protein